MINFIEFIKENIDWLKDLFMLFLAVIASVISILTYLKAKKTILQPLRSEVIKKQIDILSKLLGAISDLEKLVLSYDYFNIFDLNLKQYLIEIGYENKEQEKVDEYLKTIKAGSILCVNEDENIHAFSMSGEGHKESYKEYQKIRFQEAENGVFSVQLIHYTKQYANFNKKLSEIYSSPFIQKSIKVDLGSMIEKNQHNLSKVMKAVIEETINDFVKKDYNTINTNKFYNQFIKQSISVDEYAVPIINKIRLELKIDEKWW